MERQEWEILDWRKRTKIVLLQNSALTNSDGARWRWLGRAFKVSGEYLHGVCIFLQTHLGSLRTTSRTCSALCLNHPHDWVPEMRNGSALPAFEEHLKSIPHLRNDRLVHQNRPFHLCRPSPSLHQMGRAIKPCYPHHQWARLLHLYNSCDARMQSHLNFPCRRLRHEDRYPLDRKSLFQIPLRNLPFGDPKILRHSAFYLFSFGTLHISYSICRMSSNTQ